MKKRSFHAILSILLVLLIMSSTSVPLAFAKDNNTVIRVYYPNGDWRYVSVDLNLPLNNNPYLSALNNLIIGKNIPQGCYNEFPKGVKVNSFETKNNVSYIDIDKSLVDDLKSKNLSTDVVKDILSYNIFSFDKMIENIVFTFNGEIIDDFSTVSRTDFFVTYYEKDIALGIAKWLKEYLVYDGYTVVMTRTSDIDVSLIKDIQ